MIELSIISFIIILQLFLFLNQIRSIREYSHFIPPSTELTTRHFLIPFLDLETIPVSKILDTIGSYREVKSTSLETSEYDLKNNYQIVTCISLSVDSYSYLFYPIIRSINIYLIKNKSSFIDAEIISKKINTAKEKLLQNINLQISLSILLSIFGSLVGILCGLGEILFFPEWTIEKFTNHHYWLILPLCNVCIGLLIFMITRFIILSSAETKSSKLLDALYAHLQSDVLPMNSNNLSGEIYSLEASLKNFNLDFQKNSLKMGAFLEKNYEILLSQERILEKLETLDPSKIAKVSNSVFKELHNSMDNISLFSKEFSNLKEFVGLSTNIFKVAEKTFDKISNFEINIQKIANTISLRLDESSKLLEFLGSHLSTLENRRNDIESVVIATDNILKESYRELSNSEREILHSFQESSQIASEEYKKILNEFVRQSKDISLNLIGSLKSIEDSFERYYKNQNLPEKSIEDHSSEYSDFKDTRLQETLSKIQNILSVIEKNNQNNEDKNSKVLDNLLSYQKSLVEFTPVLQQSSPIENDIQKLITQMNLNQIYLENILKEALQDIRSENKRKDENNKKSFFGFQGEK